MFNKEEKRKMLMAGLVIGLALVGHHILDNFSATLAFLGWINDVLSPIVVAFIIFYIVNIPMKSIENNLFRSEKLSPKLKRGLALSATVLVLVFFLTVFILFAVPQLADSILLLVDQSGDIAASINDFFYSIFDRLNLGSDLLERAQEVWTGFLGGFANIMMRLMNSAREIVTGFLSGVFSTLLSIVLAIYMLLGKEQLAQVISDGWRAYSPPKVTEPVMAHLKVIDKSFEQFVRGQLMEALVLGIICYIGMLIFGFEYALLISFLVGITNIIPLLGPYIGAVPSFLLLLGVNPVHALWFLVYVIALQQIEANLIYPRVVGDAMGISGFWIMMAVIVGNNLFGVAGILIGIPLLSSFYSIIGEVTKRRLLRRGFDDVKENKEDADTVEA